jgi:hypothetical protein
MVLFKGQSLRTTNRILLYNNTVHIISTKFLNFLLTSLQGSNPAPALQQWTDVESCSLFGNVVPVVVTVTAT